MTPVTVTCSGCGAPVPAGDRFCGSCGNPITGSAILSSESAAAAYDPWIELLQKLRQATIGEYEIKGELGRGGMAAVFLAHDLHLNRKVAIKVMLPGLVYGERMWERFLAEARTAARLDHPNVIYIHSVRDKDRFLYFVMKYVDGRPLDDILARSGPLALPVAQVMLVEVARALDYAHREGVVHRDIKPANIMIDHRGNAIVMDFGIARAHDSAHFTQTGATIGTPAYMSPEQCHGRETTAASDQYSLGIVAYEMLAGKPPFTGTPIELQLAHIQESPRPLRELRRELPERLAAAVMRMMEKDPARRFGSLAEVVREFAEGCDVTDPAIREQIATLARSGPPRRQSFPPTPVSPAPGSLAAIAGADDAVRSAETSSVSALAPDDARSRPTAAIDSGSFGAVTADAPLRDGHAGTTAPAPRRKRGPALAAAAVVTLTAAVIVAVALTRGGKAASGPAKPDTASAELPAADAASAAAAALGDSVAVGHGPDASTPVRGRRPRTVAADAVALLTPSLAGGLTVGDTVRAHLDAVDDEGAAVTSPDIVWSTSDPHVVKFAGPGRLVGVKEGRATITVRAARVEGSIQVTVRPARR
ncbi:MAG: protein kinase [Gemmatimonadaceae bacterium]|nr:protein kinase [Gemmatimonadaceae bacterium]